MILLAYPLFRWIAGGATGLAPRLLTVALIVLNSAPQFRLAQ